MAKRVDAGTNTISPAEYVKLTAELATAQRNIAQATEALAAERGIKAGIFRRAKNAGADIEAMKSLASLAAMDVDERNRLMENVSKYAGWTGVVLWRGGTDAEPQGGLFDNDPAAKEALTGLQDNRDYTDGFNSAKAGGDRQADNKKEPGSRSHQKWDEGFGDYEFEHGGKPASKIETASTARKGAKRGTVVPTGKAPEVAPAATKRGKQKALPAPTVN